MFLLKKLIRLLYTQRIQSTDSIETHAYEKKSNT